MLNGFLLDKKVDDYLKEKKSNDVLLRIKAQRRGAEAKMLNNYRLRIQRFITTVLSLSSSPH